MEKDEILQFAKETLELQKQSKYVLAKISDLHPFDGNPSMETEAGIDMLRESILGQGLVEDVILYRREGKLMIVAGHKRVRITKELGMKHVPAKIYPFRSYKHAVLYCIASNRITQLAQTDMKKIKECLDYCDDGLISLALSGFSKRVQESMIDYENYPEEAFTFVDQGDRRVVTIRCESDEELSEVKEVLGIGDKKVSTIKGSELLEILDPEYCPEVEKSDKKKKK